mgnify:CR=1 FL=1
MRNSNIALREVDEVKVTILMDNTVDLLMPGSDVAQRFSLSYGRPLPIAEHGFSALVKVKSGDKEDAILFDAGISSDGLLNNLKALGLNLHDIHTIVLSHGHSDHTLGLPGLIEHLGINQIKLLFHPDAYLKRKIVMPNGYEWDISGPGIENLQGDNITKVEKRDPTLLANGMVLASGEIERTTGFETGLPVHYSKRYDVWEQDPLIKDDQSLIINVKGQGLVIITGCGHSGVINTIRYAQSITNNNKVLAVLGGFHLTGGIFEKIIPPTIDELLKISPRYVMPGHCTGWSAIHQIATAMPQAFIPNNVGTTLTFER